MNLDREFERLAKRLDKMTAVSEKTIAKEYAGMLRALRHELSDWQAKYEIDGKLTYSELAKYDRISKFNAAMAAVGKEHSAKIAKEIRKSIRDNLVTSYTGTIEAVSDVTKRSVRGVLNQNVIDAILQSPHSGLKLNERLALNRAGIEVSIRETLTQGLTRGESYKQMADRLKVELEGDAVKAMRIVRTEGHRAQEAGKYESLKHAQNQGVMQKKWWLNVADERVRDSHNHMGDTYGKDNMIGFEDDFENPQTGGKGPYPGMMGEASDDINCRCKLMTEIVAIK